MSTPKILTIKSKPSWLCKKDSPARLWPTTNRSPEKIPGRGGIFENRKVGKLVKYWQITLSSFIHIQITSNLIERISEGSARCFCRLVFFDFRGATRRLLSRAWKCLWKSKRIGSTVRVWFCRGKIMAYCAKGESARGGVGIEAI